MEMTAPILPREYGNTAAAMHTTKVGIFW
jgi:hypothetical protein